MLTTVSLAKKGCTQPVSVAGAVKPVHVNTTPPTSSWLHFNHVGTFALAHGPADDAAV